MLTEGVNLQVPAPAGVTANSGTSGESLSTVSAEGARRFAESLEAKKDRVRPF